MTNKNSTKRALVTSVLAIVLCLTMLIGTTFAWFTDTATTGVNTIKSGTLKVDIVDKEGTTSLKGQSMSFVNVNGSDGILWEPGATFKTTAFKIKNDGSLALKYKLALNGVTGTTGNDKSLLDVIDFSVVGADGKTVSLDTFEGTLNTKDAVSEELYIQGKMKESAGNEYQGLELTGIGITVYATQNTYENDSKDDQYDANATYPVLVANADDLKTALTNGGTVTVTKDIATNNSGDTAADRTVISQPTNLNLDKMIISPDNMGNNNNNFAALYIDADTTINAGAEGGINTGTNGGYGINVRSGATVTINSGYYYGGGTAVQVQKGTLIINGGTFACEPFSGSYGYNFLINCIDSAYKDGTAKVVIYGGTFINFDPSNNSAEGAGTNFVADGYKVTSETQANGDVWYTVVPAK